MKIILYVCNDSANTIGKTLKSPKEVKINLKRYTDIFNPVLILSGELFDLDYNYLEIPLLKRKYFINSISKISYRLVQVECDCDVLETYKESILNSEVVLTKTEQPNYFSTNLEYDSRSEALRYTNEVKVMNKENIIMIALGGGQDA